MSPSTAQTVRFALVAAALAATSGVSGAEQRHAAPAAPAMCTEASLVNVQLPQLAAVDEIRVIVAPDSPEQGAARISVEAGRFGRVVRVQGPVSRGLKFTSPLQGSHFHVALDPVFESQRSACVEKILLLRAGTLVASIRP